MNASSRIYVAGHRGMVGAAILRRMAELELPAPIIADRDELDLRDPHAVRTFLQHHRPQAVIVAAARVGGIEANLSRPAEFLYDNLAIASSVIHEAYATGIQRLLFLGSSCIYPRMAPQPIQEDALLTGPLEPTNEGYAIAKIAGMKLCQMYRRQYGVCYHSAMPTNLYGPGDNYDLKHSHVLPALIRRFEQAKQQRAGSVTLWGTGSPLREFLHVDNLADACLFLLQLENPPDWVNVGSGEEVSIRQLAEMIRDATGADCDLVFDTAHPDGTPRKFLDCSQLRALGWAPNIGLSEGVRLTVQDYRRECAAGTARGVSRDDSRGA